MEVMTAELIMAIVIFVLLFLPALTIPGEGERKQNVFVRSYLATIVLANAMVPVSYLIGGASPDLPRLIAPALFCFCILNVSCAIALLRWKKWGFWGICATWLTAMIIGIGLGANAIVSVVICLSALAILYGVLHLGDESKAWPQLV